MRVDRLFCLVWAVGMMAAGGVGLAQERPEAPLREHWSGQWISHPTAPLREAITLHFKKAVDIKAVPAHFIVHVSADNRFVLYVNGQRVGDGPARGDLNHWRYETFDLAPMMKAGENTLAATVWNFGVYAPVAQFSDRTAFLVEGDTKAEEQANTNSSWMVEVEPGQVPLPRKPNGLDVYFASGPGETLKAADYDWDWFEREAGWSLGGCGGSDSREYLSGLWGLLLLLGTRRIYSGLWFPISWSIWLMSLKMPGMWCGLGLVKLRAFLRRRLLLQHIPVSTSCWTGRNLRLLTLS